MIGVDKVLVLAPHPDDEVIGCGAFLKGCSEAGIAVKVVIVTDGAAGVPIGTDPEIRRSESRAALLHLGVRDCEFWDYPDGGVPLGGPIAERYRALVAGYRPSHLLLPHPAESHTDHRSVTRGALMALEARWSGSLWFYETTDPCQPVNHLEAADETLGAKLAALAEHLTQLSRFDYVAHCTHLARMRGLTLNREAAEAFLCFEWDGAPQNFFVSEPLVSIVVRACDAPILRHALLSLKQQTYPWIEIVLVWFGEDAAPDTANLGLPVVLVRGTRSRGANLNAGAAAAHGEFIGFLDEDDICYVDHVAELVGELVSSPDVDIAFAGCRVVTCRREGDEVTVLEEVDRLDYGYQPGRLLLGNYMTLHSVLARRNVLRTIPFEAALEAYEDWDFLAQAEQRGLRFARVAGLLCEYRLYPETKNETGIAAIHEKRGYTAWRSVVLERICRRFTPADLERVERFASCHHKSLEDAASQRDQKANELARVRTELEEYRAESQWVRAALETDQDPSAPRADSISRTVGRNLAGPVISIVVPVYETEPELLSAMLQSIADQSYARWQLCLVDDASERADTKRALEEFAQARQGDARILVRGRAENGGIVAASNEALGMASGDYVAFVDHDDILHPDALLHVAMAALRRPGVKLIYTDNRMIDHVGNVLNVFSKPDWSPTTLLSYNYINHLAILRRDLIERRGGFLPRYAGSQDWELLLRLRDELHDGDVLHLPHPLYDWRATNTSVAYSGAAKPWAIEAARSVIGDAVQTLARRPVTVEPNTQGVGFVVNWDAETRPITVVIPTHRNREGLRLCLRGLLEETDYPDLRLLVVANRCDDPIMRADLAAMADRPEVRVVDDPGEFNWAAMMNRAVGQVETEGVLFLNDDVEVLHKDWLRRMHRYLGLPGIGAVGALLYFPNGGLQHAGIETDPDWIAANVERSLGSQEAAAIRDVSAVTGACLLTTRAVLGRVGGLDESLPVHYNDVDYCLALRQAGYSVVQASDVRLKHDESATRGRVQRSDDQVWMEAIARMRTKWGSFLKERYRPRFRAERATRMLSMQ